MVKIRRATVVFVRKDPEISSVSCSAGPGPLVSFTSAAAISQKELQVRSVAASISIQRIANWQLEMNSIFDRLCSLLIGYQNK